MEILVIRSTGALGDSIIATALYSALKASFQQRDGEYRIGISSKNHTLPVWEILEGAVTYPSDVELPKNATILDASQYLGLLPHSRPLPREFVQSADGLARFGHLCEYMACAIWRNGGQRILPLRNEVIVPMTSEEVERGVIEIQSVTKVNGGHPIVLIAPFATTPNRSIPRHVLRQVITGINAFSVPCHLVGDASDPVLDGAVRLGPFPVRQAAAVCLAAHAVLTCDSGPLHLACGAVQFARQHNIREGVLPNCEKVILVTGSSRFDAAAYEGNVRVASTGDCPVSPCGAHGYVASEEHEREFGKRFFPRVDRSACIDRGYQEGGVPPCMAAVSASEIVSALRRYLYD